MDNIIVYELKPLKTKLKLLYGIIISLFSFISFVFILYYWDITLYFGIDEEILVTILLIILSLYVGGVIKDDLDYIFGKVIKSHLLRIITGSKNIKVYRWYDLSIKQRDSIHTEFLLYLKELYDTCLEKNSKEFIKKVINYLEDIDIIETKSLRGSNYRPNLPKYVEVIALFKDSSKASITTLKIGKNENIVFLVLIPQENKDKLIQPIYIRQNLDISIFSNDEQISNALQGYREIIWNLSKLGF
ncbi:MAG: hypothetical protein ABDH21_04420 [bacterium]